MQICALHIANLDVMGRLTTRPRQLATRGSQWNKCDIPLVSYFLTTLIVGGYSKAGKTETLHLCQRMILLAMKGHADILLQNLMLH